MLLLSPLKKREHPRNIYFTRRFLCSADDSIVTVESETSYVEPEVFADETPDTRYVSVRTTETKTTQDRDEKVKPVLLFG